MLDLWDGRLASLRLLWVSKKKDTDHSTLPNLFPLPYFTQTHTDTENVHTSPNIPSLNFVLLSYIYMLMFLCPFRIGWMRFFEVSSWLGGPVPLLPVSAVQQKKKRKEKKCSSHWPPKKTRHAFDMHDSQYVLACTSLHCFLSFKFSSTRRRTSFSRFSTYACT